METFCCSSRLRANGWQTAVETSTLTEAELTRIVTIIGKDTRGAFRHLPIKLKRGSDQQLVELKDRVCQVVEELRSYQATGIFGFGQYPSRDFIKTFGVLVQHWVPYPMRYIANLIPIVRRAIQLPQTQPSQLPGYCRRYRPPVCIIAMYNVSQCLLITQLWYLRTQSLDRRESSISMWLGVDAKARTYNVLLVWWTSVTLTKIYGDLKTLSFARNLQRYIETGTKIAGLADTTLRKRHSLKQKHSSAGAPIKRKG